MLTDAIVDQINARRKKLSFWPWFAILGFFLFVPLSKIHPAIGAVWLLLYIVGIIYTRQYDQKRKTTTLDYPEAMKADPLFTELTNTFKKITSSQAVYQTLTAKVLTQLNDRKKNAGAGSLVNRKRIKVGFIQPKNVKVNVAVPAIIGDLSIYFFPDTLLLEKRGRLSKLLFNKLNMTSTTSRFIESGGSYPKDAPLIEHTWQYVNKDGSRDKRKKDNKQLPVVRYDIMQLNLPDGTEAHMYISAPDSVSAFKLAFDAISHRAGTQQTTEIVTKTS